MWCPPVDGTSVPEVRAARRALAGYDRSAAGVGRLRLGAGAPTSAQRERSLSVLYAVRIEAVDAERRTCTLQVEAVNSATQSLPDEPAFAAAVLGVLYVAGQLGVERVPLHPVVRGARGGDRVPLFEPLRRAVEEGGRLRELFQPGGPWEFVDEDIEESVQVRVEARGQGGAGFGWVRLRVEVQEASWLGAVGPDAMVKTLLGPRGLYDFLDA